MKIKLINGKEYLFDTIRKQYVKKLPEEWVRQHVIEYLNKQKGYPLSLMSIEKKNEINKIKKRCDIVCNNKNGEPLLLVECKAQNIKINVNTFNQSIIYNKTLNAKYIVITNGKKHYCFYFQDGEIIILKNIPTYNECT